MDFELTAEQEDLRDQFRRLLAAHCDHDTRRAAIDLPGAVDRGLWDRLADTGVFALRLPEDAGGLGAGMVETVVVQEEMGRALVPGPLAVTSVLASQISGVAEGKTVVTAVYAGPPPCIVEHLAGADVVVLMSPDGIRSIPAGSLAATALAAPLDPLTPVHRCASSLQEGDAIVGPEGSLQIWHEGTLLTAATHVGLAAAALDMATSYAKERIQFGRPIGGFQAIKHLLADALADVEVARVAVHTAAVTFDEAARPDEPVQVIAGARVLASRAAQRATRACIQVHGGMGYTWEVDAHLYLKRALVLDTHFDSPHAARDRLLAGL